MKKLLTLIFLHIPFIGICQNGFSYYNIFDTKGLEYIITIIFFISLLIFWIILNNKVKKINKKIKNLTLDNININKGKFYTKNYTWLFLNKNGNVSIGVNDILPKIIGNVNIEYVKSIGDIIKKGDLILIINKDNKKINITSPISGRIVNINDNYILNDNWLYSIYPLDIMNDIQNCYIGDNILIWLNDEIKKLKDFISEISSTNKLILQDGGELNTGILTNMSKNEWDKFDEFINISTSN